MSINYQWTTRHLKRSKFPCATPECDWYKTSYLQTLFWNVPWKTSASCCLWEVEQLFKARRGTSLAPEKQATCNVCSVCHKSCNKITIMSVFPTFTKGEKHTAQVQALMSLARSFVMLHINLNSPNYIWYYTRNISSNPGSIDHGGRYDRTFWTFLSFFCQK